jgi:GT2 family glycosyltransferase
MKNSNPLVFIVVLNWNGLKDTEECLVSISGIQYEPFRVIVVDNGSTDLSPGIIKEKFPDVDLIEVKENLRFAGGNNLGMQKAMEGGADYILLLNNDTIVEPLILRELVKGFSSNPGAGITGPKIFYYYAPGTIWSAGGEVIFYRGLSRHRGIREKESEFFSTDTEVDWVTGCALMVSREVVKKIGFLDPEYYMFGEDADYCFRAKEAGYRILFIPGAKVFHKITASTGGGLTPFKAYHRVRSSYIFFRKYAKPGHWLTIPFFVSAGIVKVSVSEVLRGNKKAVFSMLKGFFHILRRSPSENSIVIQGNKNVKNG